MTPKEECRKGKKRVQGEKRKKRKEKGIENDKGEQNSLQVSIWHRQEELNTVCRVRGDAVWREGCHLKMGGRQGRARTEDNPIRSGGVTIQKVLLLMLLLFSQFALFFQGQKIHHFKLSLKSE